MSDDSITVQILISIRDEVRQTNQRLDQTNQRLDQTNQRLDQTNQRLEYGLSAVRDQIVEADLRSATRDLEHTAATRNLHEMLTRQFELRDRVERCELDIADLKKRVG